VLLVLVVGVCAVTAMSSGAIISEVARGQTFDNWLSVNFNSTYEKMFPASAENDFVYAYSQSSGHFEGPAYDGGHISVTGCSGRAGHCRNNPSCQCQVAVGPLPRGTYRLSQEVVFKGMVHCYALTQIAGDACGRSGFLIHGGSCSADPSEGCIVISDANVREKIKGGGSMVVS